MFLKKKDVSKLPAYLVDIFSPSVYYGLVWADWALNMVHFIIWQQRCDQVIILQ